MFVKQMVKKWGLGFRPVPVLESTALRISTERLRENVVEMNAYPLRKGRAEMKNIDSLR